MKNHTNQRLVLALLFSLVLAIVLQDATGAEATAITRDGFNYTIEGKSAVITGHAGSETAITIPGEVNGIPVKGIGDSAFAQSRLVSVIIPIGVTSIGSDTFIYCSSLMSVILPEGLTSIGSRAFEDCSNLQSISIPASVTDIGERAFFNCNSLESVDIPSNVTSIGAFAFGHSGTTEDGFLYSIEGETAVITGYSGSDTAITIPAQVEDTPVISIGDWAFHYHEGEINYTSVIIPDGITRIGDSAFGQCSSLTSVTIPHSVTSIGNAAFTGCNSLESVIIGGGVTSIGDNTFSYNYNLTSVTIPANVTDINYYAFYKSDNLTIHGYKGSYAETFARENYIPFIVVEGQPDDVSDKYVKMADDIYAAGDSHKWSKSDAWNQEQQESFWGVLKASWMNDVQSIIDFVYTNHLNYAPDYIGFTGEEVTAKEELKVPLAMVLWGGFGEVTDKVLTTTPSGKTFNLSKGEYPTLDDFFAEVIAKYDDVNAYVVAGESPKGVDVFKAAKDAFISEWASKDEPQSGQSATNFDSTENETGQSTEAAYQELTIGSRGQEVLDMKQRFLELGYFRTTSFNDRFTDNTADTVRLFEKNNGLPVDGLADPEMLALLFSEGAVGK